MYETTSLQLSHRAEKIFLFFLQFYPKQYRKRFGQEMFYVFQDVCQEELENHKTLSASFWIRQIVDIARSIMHEHLLEVQHKGMKKYLEQTFHLSPYYIVSMGFLLPVILMTCTEILSRIIQKDMTHYNRPLYAFFSHTFLYWPPVLFTWVIIFPLLAAFISLIPLVVSFKKRKTAFLSWRFLLSNIIGIAILLFGFGFIALIRLHDFLPCLFYGLTHFGFGQLHRILSVCQKA